MFKLTGPVASLALGFIAASPANAVLMDAIKITSATGDYIQVAELQAFSGTTNVALASNGGVATAFSSLLGFTGPDKANDGLTDGQPYGDGVYISQGTSASEYLLITFARTYDISSIKIFGREDCCQQRDNFSYILFDHGAPGLLGGMDATGQDARNNALVDFSVAAVLEPATWAMMIGGFGMVGAAMRRRAKAAVSFS